MDYIMNGNDGLQGQGDTASVLLENDMNPHALRPFIGEDGRHYVNAFNTKGELIAKPLTNAIATLRKDEWQLLDDIVVKVARERLRAVADLISTGNTFNIPNGMGTTVFQTETQSDINPASVSMDGLRENANDRPEYELTNLPLPIIHKDFHFSARQIATSRRMGTPLDTSMLEMSARKVAEQAEKLLLGVSAIADQYAFGGGTIYGYTDFPDRLTKTITAPTASGWTGATFLAEVLAMMQQSRDVFHYGPWVLYVASAWDQYLDNDYVTTTSTTITVRERVLKSESLSSIRTLDFLTNFDVVLVQMSSDVVREVIGMNMTTMQWDTQGGLKKHFKIMTIMVPQLRADFNSNTGIVHGSV